MNKRKEDADKRDDATKLESFGDLSVRRASQSVPQDEETVFINQKRRKV